MDNTRPQDPFLDPEILKLASRPQICEPTEQNKTDTYYNDDTCHKYHTEKYCHPANDTRIP